MAQNDRRRDRRPAPVQYHPRLTQDFDFVAKICGTELPQKFERQIVMSELRECLDSVNLGGEAGQYELRDFSMHTFGLPDFAAAPVELALVDKLRPEGIPPEHGNAPLPLPYCPIQLANFLSGRGYEGTFIDTQIDYAEKQIVNFDTWDPSDSNEPKWGQDHKIGFNNFQERFPMMPFSLRIRQRPSNSDGSRDLSSDIILYPAHPTNSHRMALLKTYAVRSDFRTILSSFWLWQQSWDFQFTPSVCAFIVLSYLQRHEVIPSLRLSTEGSGPSVFTKYYWIRQAVPSLPGPVYKRVEIPIPPLLGKQIRIENMKAQIAEFFEFWATDGIDGPRCKDYIFSICDGKELARAVPHSQPFRSKKGFMTHITESNKQYFTGDVLGNRNVQSPMWKYQALVIVDPFLGQHNVTHTATSSLVNKLRNQAKVTSQLLKKGHSPLEIFGPSITDRRTSRTHTTSTQGVDGFFPVSTLDQTVHERRNWTIFLVNEAVRKRYGHNYHVECFGSTRYGVDSATSDLDLVIVDANRPLGFCYEAKLPIIYNVRDLGKTLHQNGFKVEEVIPQAAVPIVKFYDPRNRMQCDINVNDQLGLFNTQLIAHYCELFHPLPTLLLAIKKWAKSLGLNNPSGRGGSTSFSSYALTVMTIGYLQPLGILPNLQAGLSPLPPPPRNPEFDAEGVYWQRERTGPPKRCDRRFNRLQYWQPPGDKKYDIHSLLLGWFRYWGEQHEYATQLMSIRDGGILTRVIEPPKKKKEKEKKFKKGKAKGKDKEGTEDVDAAQATDTPSPRPESPSSALEKVSLKEEPEEKSILSEDEENARDADGEGTAEDLAAVDLANGKQPKWWKNATLVVADPFILTKNVTGSVSHRVIDRFKADCRRAIFIMEHGGNYEDLLGTGETLSANPRFNQGGYFTRSRERRQKALETNKVPTATTATIPRVGMEAAAKQGNNALE